MHQIGELQPPIVQWGELASKLNFEMLSAYRGEASRWGRLGLYLRCPAVNCSQKTTNREDVSHLHEG